MPKVAVSDETLLLSGVVYTDGHWLRMLGVRPGGSSDGGGYSRVARKGKTVYAHRLAYETWVGPIPEGHTIDHLCRMRNCIKPTHLEAVPPRTNLLRGVGAAGINARKTHCPRGHPYDEANTIITAQGSRLCRACYRTGPRSRQTHCRRGHPLDDANTVVQRDGSRRCRRCREAYNAAYYKRRARS